MHPECRTIDCSQPHKCGHIDPHRQHIVGIRVNVDGSSQLCLLVFEEVYSSALDLVQHLLSTAVTHVDGKAIHLWVEEEGGKGWDGYRREEQDGEGWCCECKQAVK